jgi:hypothetical protein
MICYLHRVGGGDLVTWTRNHVWAFHMLPYRLQAGQSSALAAFKAQFDDVSFARGTEIAFAATAGGGLATRVDGREVQKRSVTAAL